MSHEDKLKTFKERCKAILQDYDNEILPLGSIDLDLDHETAHKLRQLDKEVRRDPDFLMSLAMSSMRLGNHLHYRRENDRVRLSREWQRWLVS